MGSVIPDSDVKIRTLMEYLRVQGHSSIADLLVDAKITEESEPMGVFLFLVSSDELFINVPPATFHFIQTNPDVKNFLEKSFLKLVPTYRKMHVFKVGFRILPA